MNAVDSPWLRAEECRIDDFIPIVEQDADPGHYPRADSVEHRTIVYSATALRPHMRTLDGRREIQAEIAHALMEGPGIVLFRAAFERDVVDRASQVFRDMIAEQHATNTAVGDHFAKPGNNDRVWNVQEKFALIDPESFAAYYANDIVALASEAWLGPGYQVTSQVNVVNPGGEAQDPHRDYHLGFLTDDQAETFPSPVHRLSPLLTLQGAVAHCAMPLETGPTLYLPHSQKYLSGYLAWRRPEFREYFQEHHVQLSLEKGDVVFFNPALFHAAGHNRTADVFRMANLLQVSSAFGRAMEAVDRRAMSLALFPVLRRLRAEGLDGGAIDHIIAASAEGYAFPGDLDRTPPVSGLAPPSMADKVRLALNEDWSVEALAAALSPPE